MIDFEMKTGCGGDIDIETSFGNLFCWFEKSKSDYSLYLGLCRKSTIKIIGIDVLD